VCFACRSVAGRLGVALAPVFPIRLCPVPSPLYAVLMGYKEAPVREARRHFAPMVRVLAEQFLAAHGRCLAVAGGGPLEVVLPVPSTARPSGAPLAGVTGLAAAACAHVATGGWLPEALVRSAAPVAHMQPDVTAFRVPASMQHRIDGRRVLLLDDTYVSGARSQSAAAALRTSGARAVVIVALGRVLRPDRSALHAGFLVQHRRSHGGPVGVHPPLDRCSRCVQTPALTE
jgi:hypothetical protein